MKYNQLIQFDPIETVIELRSADNTSKAKELVSTYVMSDGMADLINAKIFTQLTPQANGDNRGVLLVGNYGTGKSHLMSVISSIAENAELLPLAQNGKFRKDAEVIAGKFEVLRVEIGATSMSLRAIITGEIEKDLARRGISFKFPNVSEVANNKDALNDMMAAFDDKYPNRGYLIVVDELLDYLKSRKDNELFQDFNFMRELGEFIKNSRFRMISGIQEALFDNPAFHNVSGTLLKMKDRYEPVLIRSQDIAYVAKQRVLRKTPEQKAIIRAHLEKYCNLYGSMSEQMEEYVDMFPIHPAYISTFQRMVIVEKREVLKTISDTIRDIINTDLPAQGTGLVSYDSYWTRIKNDPGKRVEPAIAEVLQKSGVLEDIIKRSFPKPAYKETALKIIAALSVHRLTTATLEAKLGLTAENLKDELCIYMPIPQSDAAFLLATVQSVLRTIMQTVSGQFIEYNKENEQYFLDLHKDVDYDAKIVERASSMSDDRMNNYFFNIIWDCLDWHPTTYVSGHQIFQYSINWQEKNYFREGYLFMGNSNERPTAQPPRDFYAYFLPPYGQNTATVKQSEDEVYFIFQKDKDFESMLHYYAGAKECEVFAAQGDTKAAYAQRAKEKSKQIIRWMEDHKTQAFTISYKGTMRTMLDCLHGVRMDMLTIKSAVDTCVSRILNDYFIEQYPDFPKFKSPVTDSNKRAIREAAMDVFAGKSQKLGIDIMESLGLLHDGKIKPENSKYAVYYMQMLNKLPEGHVLNFSDIMYGEKDEYFYDKRFKLPDVLFSIVLTSLVYSGHCVLVADNNIRYDASNIEKLLKDNTADVLNFKRLERPKAAPIMRLRRFFNAVGVNDGLLVSENTWDTAVVELMKKTQDLSNLSLQFINFLDKGTLLWGDSIIPANQAESLKDDIKPLKKAYEDVRSRFSSPAKLKNFDYDEEALAAVEKAVKALSVLLNVEKFKSTFGDIMSYLAQAELKVEEGTALRSKFAEQKQTYLDMRSELLSPDYDEADSDDLMEALEALRSEYISYYIERHKACRLGVKDAERKQKLLDGDVVSRLKTLSGIGGGILPTGKYTDLVTNQLQGLKVCYECTSVELQNQVECPHCGFNPSAKETGVSGRLDYIEDKLSEILNQWRDTLLGTLDDPMVTEKRKYMSTELAPFIEEFIKTKHYPKDLESFCKAVREAFADYECVELDGLGFLEDVLSWGTLSPDAFKKRMTDYIDAKIAGKNKDQVRIAFTDK